MKTKAKATTTTADQLMTSGLERVTRVLKAIKVPGTRKSIGEALYVETYCNGREHGYMLSCSFVGVSVRAVITENRNSDDLVIYLGGTFDFRQQGNVPEEHVYRERTFVPGTGREAERTAAKYLTTLFTEALAQHREELAALKTAKAAAAKRPSPREDPEEAYRAFMGMSDDSWLGLVKSLMSGGVLTPAEQQGYRRACVDRAAARQAVHREAVRG